MMTFRTATGYSHNPGLRSTCRRVDPLGPLATVSEKSAAYSRAVSAQTDAPFSSL